jgi:hypothetical protein
MNGSSQRSVLRAAKCCEILNAACFRLNSITTPVTCRLASSKGADTSSCTFAALIQRRR